MFKDKTMKWIIIITLLFTIGCASVKTTITNPQGETYIVQSKKDALVTMKKDGVELIVDNRGKLGLFENLMGIIFMKTDIELKNKGDNN